jgi:hypothetical protein
MVSCPRFEQSTSKMQRTKPYQCRTIRSGAEDRIRTVRSATWHWIVLLYYPNSHASIDRKATLSCFRPQHEGIWAIIHIAPLILNLGIRRSWAVIFTPRPLYPRGTPALLFEYGVGLTRLSGRFGEDQSLLRLSNIQQWFLGCPAHCLVIVPTELSTSVTHTYDNCKYVLNDAFSGSEGSYPTNFKIYIYFFKFLPKIKTFEPKISCP